MKSYSFFEPTSKELIECLSKKHDFGSFLLNMYSSPQEDFFQSSEKFPVFAVADGVTLDFKKLFLTGRPYPDPSPAGDVARIFCEDAIHEAEKQYEAFDESSLLNVLKVANESVNEYNNRAGRVIISGNVTGKFAATGSVIVVKEDKVFWSRVCDAYFAHFDKDMNLKLLTSGLCKPYAVFNGEEKMIDLVESGVSKVELGDRLFVFSDGFENYFRNCDGFFELFMKLDDGTTERLADFTRQMNTVDPEKYGHEKSMIVVEV